MTYSSVSQTCGPGRTRWVTNQLQVGCVAPSAAIIQHMERWYAVGVILAPSS